MAQLILVDYALLAVIGLSVLIGVWRGFLREFISLATWVAAVAVAYFFAADAAYYLTPYIGVPSVRAVVAFGALFLATLFLGGLVNLLIAQIVKHTGLSGTDRLIGVLFGAARGGLLVALLVMLAKLTPLPQDPWWGRSVLIPEFEPLADWLYRQLPDDLLLAIGLPEDLNNAPVVPTLPGNSVGEPPPNNPQPTQS